MSVPIANLALRLSAVGCGVLPAEHKHSSAAFLAFMVAAVVAVVLALAVSTGFVLTAFTAGLLALPIASASASAAG